MLKVATQAASRKLQDTTSKMKNIGTSNSQKGDKGNNEGKQLPSQKVPQKVKNDETQAHKETPSDLHNEKM